MTDEQVIGEEFLRLSGGRPDTSDKEAGQLRYVLKLKEEVFKLGEF
jgi:hypothetical protein